MLFVRQTLLFLGIASALSLTGCVSSQRRYEMLPNVAALT